MFEQKIEEVTRHLIDKMIGTQATISLEQIASSEAPDAVKHFFHVDCEKWVNEERERLLTSPHFDYSDDEIVQMFQEFVSASRHRATFSRDEFVEALDGHVKLFFNYVCRPQYTLLKYVFSNNNNVSADHIIHAMKYFVDYRYYQLIVEEYLRSKSIRSMSSEKFENLLATIDNELVRNFDSYKLSHLTTPIFMLFHFGMEQEPELAPIEALSVFYADKNLNEIVDHLDEEKQHRSHISMHDLIMLLGESDYSLCTDIGVLFTRHVDTVTEDVISDDTQEDIFIPADEKKPDINGLLDAIIEKKEREDLIDGSQESTIEDLYDSSAEELAREKTASQLESAVSSSASGDSHPEDSKYESELREGMEQVKPIPAEFRITNDMDAFPEEILVRQEDQNLEERTDVILKNDDDTGFIISVEDNIPDIRIPQEKRDLPTLNIGDVELSPTQTEPRENTGMPGKENDADIQVDGDLLTAISQKNKRKYIKRIFKKNDQAYENAIEILNRTKTWREASAYLDEIFLKNDIDMYSRIAVKFTDEIYKRYLPQT